MASLAAIGGLAYLFVCIVGGARLLLLALRTRKLPEFVLGMALFLLGGVGAPLGTVARMPTDLSLDVRVALLVAQCAITVIGMTGFNIFTYQVFRSGETWARLLAGALSGSLLLGMLMVFFMRGFAAELESLSAGYLIQQLAALATLTWAAWESLRYSGILKCRLALDLADPVVFDRVRLWGSAQSIGAVLSATAIGTHLMGINLTSTAAGAAFVGIFGFLGGSSIYLAFLPPQAYTNWVIARFEAGASQ